MSFIILPNYIPVSPPKSKVILTHVNSTDYQLDGLKHILWISSFGYHKYTPLHTSL